MKKKISVFLLMIFPILLISACSGKQTDPKVFGESFFESLVYGKKSEIIEEEAASKDLHKNFEQNTESMKQGFQSGASSMGATLTDEQAQKLADDFMQQVNKKTSFKVVEAKTEKKTMKITYEIKGIDYIGMTEGLMNQSVEFIKNDPSIMGDTKAMTDKIVDTYDQTILSAKIIEKPIRISVTFIKNDDGKWDTNDPNAVLNLSLATLFGQKDEKELSANLIKVMEEVQTDASDNQIDEDE